MAIDPKVENLLKTIENSAAQIRTTLSPPVVTPPPVTVPSVTLLDVVVTTIAVDNVKVDYVLSGNPPYPKIALAVVPGTWLEFPASSTANGTVNFKPTVTNTDGSFHFHILDSATNKWIVARSGIIYHPFASPVVTPPVVTPPVITPGSGKFSFATDKDGNLSLYRDSKLFIPIGVNVPGPHGYWGGGFAPTNKAARIKQDWGWNFIRLFEQRPGGGDCTQCPSANNSWSIADVVNEYTAQGFVVMIDWHQYDFGAELTPAKSAEMVSVWTAWANQFKDNPLVWFELCNEPEATFHSYNHGATNNDQAQAMMAQRWFDVFKPVVQAIRSTGATNMIVVNDCQAGQGCDDFFKIGPSTGSGIMLKGAELLASDPTGNMMWDVHAYDNFGWSSPNEANNDCSNRYTDEQRAARVVDYIKRIWQTTGRPVFAGEFGWRVGDQRDVENGFHYPFNGCGSRTLKGQVAWTSVMASLNAGGAQWPGFPVTYNGNDAYDATGSKLTECGKDWWNACQRATAKMQVANAPTDAAASRNVISDPTDLAEAMHLWRLSMPIRATAHPYGDAGQSVEPSTEASSGVSEQDG